MDDEAAKAIAPRLAPGENIVWAGRPHPPVYAYYNGGGMGCFVVFCLFALALQSGSWLILLAGVLLLLMPTFAGLKGRSVRYALTDRRAIMIATWPWPWHRTIPVDRFNVCIRQNFNKDWGSIMFRKIEGRPWEIWRGTPFHADAFVGLDDADEVERLIGKRVGSRSIV